MSDERVHHSTFVIERDYPVPPARVFAAWANPKTKLRWFFCHPEWTVADYALDFRAGGSERLATGPAGGPVHGYAARYHEIAPERRILYSYEMRLDETWLSVSLVTVEFAATQTGTRMTFTEQGAYLTGGQTDAADREHGTGIGFDNLARELTEEAAPVRP
jgi:uncharacterized protein YndB with AHSA1/START domain